MRWKSFLFPLLLVTVLLVLYFSGALHVISWDNLKKVHGSLQDYVKAHPYLSPFLFIFGYIVFVVSLIPDGYLLSLLAGSLFIQPLSTFYVSLAGAIGGCFVFLASRTILARFYQRIASPVVTHVQEGFHRHATNYLLFIRILPVPFSIANIALACTKINLWTFAWTTFVGLIPLNFVFTQAGAGLTEILESPAPFEISTLFNWQIKLALAVLALLTLLPIFLKKWKWL